MQQFTAIETDEAVAGTREVPLVWEAMAKPRSAGPCPLLEMSHKMKHCPILITAESQAYSVNSP